MPDRQYSLAIETSSRAGSIALGCDQTLIEHVDLPQPKRHRVELMPTIDQLCRKHQVRPGDLGEVAINIGPGSFTGLRIAVTTAKMLAMTLGIKVVAADATQVIAAGVDSDTAPHLAVCLATRQDTFYCGLFEQHGKGWQLCDDAKVMTVEQLLANTSRPLAMVGEGCPEIPATEGIVLIDPPSLRAADLWRITRGRACCDPLTLSPIYAHPPQAQSQWDQRYGKTATIQTRKI
jgi:tRNA threonylcarbamoyl adenosine modification protein YeaZ